MAVYTQLTQAQIEEILMTYSIGRLSSFSEISSGIENSNFFLDVISEEQGLEARYVLTIFESMSASELPFFNDLTAHLARQGLKVPAPVQNLEGEEIFVIENKPAIIVPCMSGASEDEPSLPQSEAVASYLAQMHLALRDFPRNRPLARDESWMMDQVSLLESSSIPHADLDLLKRSIRTYQDEYRIELERCPQGIVHGDLFRDNVLFEGGEVSGVIDFYHACQATLLFDLAVMVNDWAWDASQEDYDSVKKKHIECAYQSLRPWTEHERHVWPKCLEVAALRFWISRLVSFYLPGYQQHSVAGDTAKNPDEMKSILLKAQSM